MMGLRGGKGGAGAREAGLSDAADGSTRDVSAPSNDAADGASHTVDGRSPDASAPSDASPTKDAASKD